MPIVGSSGRLYRSSGFRLDRHLPRRSSMQCTTRSFTMALVAYFTVALVPVSALANSEAVETARLLAILLDSGRVVVGANQPLINDKDKGEKGFTPDVFEKQLQAKFKERAGVDLMNVAGASISQQAKTLLPALVESSKK